MRGSSTCLPFGREVLEAITAILAVAVLFYVSFWLIARLEQKRWLEFLRTRVWSAVSVGSTAALVAGRASPPSTARASRRRSSTRRSRRSATGLGGVDRRWASGSASWP